MALPTHNLDLALGKRLLLPVAIALGFEGFQLPTDDSTSSFKIINLSGSTLFEVKGDGSGGLGASGMSADTIAEFTSGVGVTVDGLLIKDGFVVAVDSQGIKLGTGTDDTISHNGTLTTWTHTTGNLLLDNTASTGATIAMLGTDTSATKFAIQNNSAADIFSVTPSSATAGTALVAGVLDLNGTLDQDAVLNGTGDAANIAATMSHASQSAEALDVSIAQITNARTSGVLIGVRSSVTSLTGSTAGTDHYAFFGDVTVGEATADHFVIGQGLGFDSTIDTSGAATGEAGVLLSANKADAWSMADSTGDILVLDTRTGAFVMQVLATLNLDGALDQDFALTAAGDGANIAGTINHATANAEALDVSIAQLTAVRSSGKVVAGKFSVTSLAADTGGDFACLELVSVDGGGTTPTHSGIYCADPLDALIKVAADGDGGFVVGATMTVSPEATAESGYFKVAIGATIYQVPIYAA